MKYQIFLLFGVALMHPFLSSASVLNWTEVNWTPSSSGSQQDTFQNVDNSNIDVSLSISLEMENVNTPSLASTTSVSSNALVGSKIDLGVNYLTRDRTKNYIDVTIKFSSLVSNVSFSLVDVDRGSQYINTPDYNSYWEDVIENVSGKNGTSTIAGSASYVGNEIAVDTTTDPGDTLYRGQVSNNWNDESLLTFTWDTAVSEVSFRYAAGQHSMDNPNYQVIGLSGISFEKYNAVPEPSTYLIGGLSSLFLLFSLVRKRKKKSNIVPQ